MTNILGLLQSSGTRTLQLAGLCFLLASPTLVFAAPGSDYTLDYYGDVAQLDDTLVSNAVGSSGEPLAGNNNWAYEMINVYPVWNDGYTGEGIKIRVNDDGVEVDHDEFEGRFDILENSCDWDAYAYKPYSGGTHGTRVTGIVLANDDNNRCAVGIAPEAKFSSCNIFSDNNIFSMLSHKPEVYDISQNSWGYLVCTGENGNNGGDSYIDEDIIYPEGCPFGVDSQFQPCDVCEGQFVSTDREISETCANAILYHCYYHFREDQYACLDFPELLFGSGGSGLDIHCNYHEYDYWSDVLKDGIVNGRDGKGVIWVFASGNGFKSAENVNFSTIPKSRFTITVGAVGKDGLHTDYSTPGAALTVSAPAGDFDDGSHIATAGDRNTCTDSGAGTSFACPIVTGVIALMLEANPELTWRDVQGILAETSQDVADSLDVSFTTNAAGISHSNWYGFGIVDAKAAVDAAKSWELFSEESIVVGVKTEPGAGTVLSDSSGNMFESTIIIEEQDEAFITESTEILLKMSHYNRGDLEIRLVSPSGTTSIMHPGKLPEDTEQFSSGDMWKLMTVRNWGENPVGEWKLVIRDLVDRENNTAEKPNDNVFKAWYLNVHGRTGESAPTVAPVPTETPGETEAPDPTPGPTKKPKKKKKKNMMKKKKMKKKKKKKKKLLTRD
jgi:subtilisin family serine protease